MKRIYLISTFLLLLAVIVLNFYSCKKELPQSDSGKIIFNFKHQVGNEDLEVDELLYTDAAGYKYLINEIQYFISDVRLYKSDGTVKHIQDWKAIHYVDTDIQTTHQWEVFDEITPGTYDSISFVFGIDSASNQSYMYVNSPENNMFWPDQLGGGYHYMKCNGKYESEDGAPLLPFNLHLGIGQVYSGETNDVNQIIGFVHNHFRVSLSESSFTITKDRTNSFSIIMNVEQWFKEPYVFDHQEYGAYIMQNQKAMNMVRQNGHNVFSIEK
ncbi:MAG: hypothetical protein JEZ03_11935 [Bacteroidales bacterium]|nr:hypothetical protein [Bacteroidales bacterium]